MKERLVRFLGPALIVLVFLAAAALLHREFEEYRYQDIERSLAAIPAPRLFWALALTLVNYLALTGYDFLAHRYLRRPLQYGKIAFTSFIAYVFSYNVGLSVLGGSAIRYRLYSTWGLTGVEIAKVVVFCGLTLWLGFFALGGVVFLLWPMAVPAPLHLLWGSMRPLGLIFLALTGGYVAAAVTRTSPFQVREWEFTFPSPALSLAQIALSSLDWAISGAVFYVLLPPGATISYPALLGVFLLGQIAGLLSHVPGGLGVFETVVLFSLAPALPAPAVLGSLLAYRAIYYLLPLGLAIGLLGAHELLQRKESVKRVARVSFSWARQLAPSTLAVAAFLAGAVLLLSGATPATGGRLAWLKRFLPLPIMEISHFAGSLAGVGLLLLARALQQRIDAAYHLTVVLLYTGIVASLLKGLDYEEAIVLSLLLAALLPSQRHFYRKASLISHRFTPGWIGAIVVVLVSSVGLGLFSHKHMEYSADLWWRFAFFEDAPRFLRATVGALGSALVFGLATLLRPAPLEPALPTPEDMEKARPIVAASRRTSAHLALLGDKSFLFGDRANAFIMYAVQGRSFIAMGDPVGPLEAREELAWRFHEMADRHRAWTVFYEVQPENLPLYVDLGLSFVKLGEEARVPLEGFSLEGRARKGQRHIFRKLENEGCRFDWIPPEGVPSLLPDLEEISNAWLSGKNTREKGFSLGFFDPAYLRQLPLATIRREGQLLAFSNVWLGAEKEELSVDLMRHRLDAPPSVMEFLFIHLMLWGHQEGYRWFNLGMAPLSGLPSRPLAPLWNRLGSLVFRHGEQVYNFQGLRQYKEKFDPEWQPRYLAAPGGIALPRVLANVATLISGGLRGVVSK
jgi:phosphatidylglycerol lysyltransferase